MDPELRQARMLIGALVRGSGMNPVVVPKRSLLKNGCLEIQVDPASGNYHLHISSDRSRA